MATPLWCTTVPTSDKTRQPLQTTQQSTHNACAIGVAIGALVGTGCCVLERHLPSKIWPLSLWPLNIICARIVGSLVRHSLVYAYLAFAESHGITCHQTTMHISAGVTDWLTYVSIKNYS